MQYIDVRQVGESVVSWARDRGCCFTREDPSVTEFVLECARWSVSPVEAVSESIGYTFGYTDHLVSRAGDGT